MQQSFMPPICAVNPVVGTMKRLGRSALFLWICILQTAATGFALLASFGFFGNASLYQVDGMEIAYQSTAFSAVVPGLFALGLWLVRAACKNNASPFVTTGGLKTIKVLITISLVMIYIVAGASVLLVLGVLLLGSAATDILSNPSLYENEEFLDEFAGTYTFSLDEFASAGLFSILAVVMIVLLAVLAYVIVYYHSLRRGVTAILENAEGILSDRSFSMFTIVNFYIMGGYSALSALFALRTLPASAIATGLVGTAYILGGVMMARYRKEMQYLRMVSSGDVPPAPMGMNVPPMPAVPHPMEMVPPMPPVPPAPPAPPAPMVQPQPVPPVQPEPIPTPDPVPAVEVQEEAPRADEFCSGCGRKRGENEKFCPGCGKPFSN